MKNFTKTFLNSATNLDMEIDHTKHNAIGAENKIFLPRKLWTSLSKKCELSKLIDSLKDNKNTIFMAGVAVGWAECHKDVE